MPHVPLKVLRGEEDQEDPKDKLFERFQAPTTTTATEDEDNESRRSSLLHDHVTTDIGEGSDEGMERYLGRHSGSIDSMNQSDNVSQEEARNIDNTGYQATGSVSHEAIELQAIVQVHQPPKTGYDSSDVSGESNSIELDRDTGSIKTISESDNASQEEAGKISNTGYQTTESVSTSGTSTT